MRNVHPKGSMSFALKLGQNWQKSIAEIPCGLKISTKSLYLTRLRRLEANLCFCIFGKNAKIQNGRHF